MKLTDIKKAINDTLKSNFPTVKVSSPDVEEGFKKPSFFVEILPITRGKEGKYHYSRSVTVVIQYFSENETELENIKMQDQLEEVFGQVLKINDRVITIHNIESEINDKVLHFQFDISYLDSLEEDKVYGYEEAEFMQELILEGE